MKKVNSYIINHEEQSITITKDFAKRSGIINSEEYRILVQFRKDFPEYTIQHRTASSNKNKNTHNGLTVDFMKKYIGVQEHADTALKEFESVEMLYKGHPAYYAKVKAWFLSKYPNYAEYNPTAPAQNANPTTIVTAA